MKNIFFALIIGFSPLFSYGQATWQKTFGGVNNERAHGLLISSGGDIIVLGQTESFGSGSIDAVIISLNIVGDTLWSATYGGSGDDIGYDILESSGGGYVFCGTTTSSGAGAMDVWLVRADINGNVLWSNTYGGANDDWGLQVSENSKGYLIAGSTYSGSFGNDDVYCIQTDFDGNTLWTKKFGGTMANRGVGTYFGTNGKIYVQGYEQNVFGGLWSNYLACLDTLGNLVFETNTKGSSADLPVDGFYDDGAYIYASGYGIGYITAGDDAYLNKRDTLGNVLWSKIYGGTAQDYFSDVELDESNNQLIAVGSSQSFTASPRDMFVVKTTLDGDTIWTRTLGDAGYNTLLEVEDFGDGTFIAVGWTDGSGAGLEDIIIIKEMMDGNFTSCNWSYCDPSVVDLSDNSGSGLSESTGATEAVFSVTKMSGTEDTDTICINCPTSSGTDVVSACESYTWIDGNTYTSSTSAPTWTLTNIAGCDSVITLNLTIMPMPTNTVTQTGVMLMADQSGATYQWIDCADSSTIAGEINQSYTPPLSGNYAVIIDLGGCIDTSACFLVDYTGIGESNSENLVLYPNPSNGLITLKFDLVNPTISLLSTDGRIISELKLINDQIDLTKYKKGVYLIRIESESQSIVKRIILK